MRFQIRRSIIAALIAGVIAACVEPPIDNSYPRKPLVTFTGEVSSSANAAKPTGSISMAIFWQKELPQPRSEAIGPGLGPTRYSSDGGTLFLSDDAGYLQHADGGAWLPQGCLPLQDMQITGMPSPEQAVFSTQSVVYEPKFPLRFSLPVHSVPDVTVQLDLGERGGSGKLSVGTIVAYEDTNKNGRYDFGKVGVEPEPIIAAPFVAGLSSFELYSLVFLDGQLPSTPLNGIPASTPQGFSIVHLKLSANGQTLELLPLDASIPLLVSSPETDLTLSHGCLSRQFDITLTSAPRPPGVVAQCFFPGARQYSWSTNSRVNCVSRGTSGQVCIGPNDPKPANWPCE